MGPSGPVTAGGPAPAPGTRAHAAPKPVTEDAAAADPSRMGWADVPRPAGQNPAVRPRAQRRVRPPGLPGGGQAASRPAVGPVGHGASGQPTQQRRRLGGEGGRPVPEGRRLMAAGTRGRRSASGKLRAVACSHSPGASFHARNGPTGGGAGSPDAAVTTQALGGRRSEVGGWHERLRATQVTRDGARRMLDRAECLQRR